MSTDDDFTGRWFARFFSIGLGFVAAFVVGWLIQRVL